MKSSSEIYLAKGRRQICWKMLRLVGNYCWIQDNPSNAEEAALGGHGGGSRP